MIDSLQDSFFYEKANNLVLHGQMVHYKYKKEDTKNETKTL